MNMAEKPQEETRENDWAITWILAAIWISGLILVRIARTDIPLKMLVIGTVFFIVLIPAMKEIARGLNRFYARRFSDKTN